MDRNAEAMLIWQMGGRVAMTAGAPHGSRGRGQVSLTASQPVTVHEVAVWELRSIWVTPDEVLAGAAEDAERV